MDDLLKKLLEAEILSEDTKSELEAAFEKQLTEAVAAAKEVAAADVRAELTDQWVNERDALIEAIDGKVGEYLENEFSELKEDINSFRDLEAEMAEKLVEAKAQMSDELMSDMAELVEKLDAFLEIRLTSEVEELREDLEAQKKNDFGRRVFESFVEEFTKNFADDDSAAGTLRETQDRLKDTEDALLESEKKLATMVRKEKMSDVLAPLSGHQREVMEAILAKVATEDLQEGYKTFIGRVLKETAEPEKHSEKETPVLAESEKKDAEKKTTVKTGDAEVTDVEKETITESTETISDLTRWQRLAGIK